MAWWDDVVRNIFGGGTAQASKPSPSPTPSKRKNIQIPSGQAKWTEEQLRSQFPNAVIRKTDGTVIQGSSARGDGAPSRGQQYAQGYRSAAADAATEFNQKKAANLFSPGETLQDYISSQKTNAASRADSGRTRVPTQEWATYLSGQDRVRGIPNYAGQPMPAMTELLDQVTREKLAAAGAGQQGFSRSSGALPKEDPYKGTIWEGSNRSKREGPIPEFDRTKPLPTRTQSEPAEPGKNIWEEMGRFFGDLGKDISFEVGTRKKMNEDGTYTLTTEPAPQEYKLMQGDHEIPVNTWNPGPDSILAGASPNSAPARNDTLYNAQSVSGSRQLTPEEWAALTPEQQQSVAANYALYQAAQKDRALQQNLADVPEDESASYRDLVDVIFGKEGGSERYAPNTIQVLKELGYKDPEKGDLDYFLNGSAISTYDQALNPTGARGELLQQLGKSAAFSNEDYQSRLASGAALLDAIRESGALSPETASLAGATPATEQVPEERRENLQNLLEGMADQGLYDTISKDATANEQFAQAMSEATEGLDPSIVANYFKENYGRLQGAMPWEQFSQYWLKE